MLNSVCGLDLPERAVPVADYKSDADILVAGAVAVDLNCHHIATQDEAPQPCTSNPARITQSIGGVGYNVSLAAHLASSKTRVRFSSMVGNDMRRVSTPHTFKCCSIRMLVRHNTCPSTMEVAA